MATHCKGFVAHFFDNEEQVLAIWFCWLSCLHHQIHMTNVQLNHINDGSKCIQHHKLSHSTKQKLIFAKTYYIITLLDSGLSEASICDQTGLNSATISCVCSQHHSNLPKATGDNPFMPTITNINYIKHFICIGEFKMAMKRSPYALSSILIAYLTPSQPICSHII